MGCIVFIDFFESLLQIGPLDKRLEEDVTSNDGQYRQSYYNDVAEKDSEKMVLDIPFVFVNPEVNKIISHLEGEAHQSVPGWSSS